MRHNAIITLTSILLLALVPYCVNAQTNVSGGIYANTTWTLANSPYIVTDTVVVFPNVTLTIQPGVIVKFANSKHIEIRQGKIIAVGTATDSITFTSNSITPTLGIYSGIHLTSCLKSNFSYCNFFYADKGIYPTPADTVFVKNSTFKYNAMGLGWHSNGIVMVQDCFFSNNTNAIWGTTGQYIVKNCRITNNENGIIQCENATIENCILDYNSVIGIHTAQQDSIRFNEIKYNGIGIKLHGTGYTLTENNEIEYNNIGVEIGVNGGIFNCNKVCNNTTYNVKFASPSNLDCITNNYWCTTDSAAIAATIYDGYDNVSYGLLTFMPIDPYQCYQDSFVYPCSATFTLYPDTSTLHNWFAIANVTGTAPIDYTWVWGDGDSSTGAYPSHTYDTAGYYNICLTIVDSAACSTSYCYASYLYKTEATMVTVNVVDQLPIGIKDLTTLERVINVFPNPTTSTFKISLSLTSVENVSIIIYNQLGQAVSRQELKNANGNVMTEIDLSQISKGLYSLTVKGDGWQTTKKILKD